MVAGKQFYLLCCALLFGAGCHLGVESSGDNDGKKTGSGPQACGTTTCSKDTVCCNASCGICTAPGGACLQIACDPATAGKRCADLGCAKDESCMDTPAGPQCIAKEDDPCSLADCPAQQVCSLAGGAAVCRGPHALDASAPDAASPVGDAGPTPSKDGGTASDASTLVPKDAATSQDAGPPTHDAGPPAVDAAPPRDAAPVDAAQPVDAAGSDGSVVPPATCATALCPVGTYCDDISGVARCIKMPTCETVTCAKGQHCELDQVVCVRAPCPPLPICVDDPPPQDPCAAVKCKIGTHCEVVKLCAAADSVTAADGIAYVPPISCEPLATCVTDTPGPCGGRTCSAGTFCCNASCGLCASKKAACLQVICDPAPVTASY
jgi:hypothetical protein